MGLELGAELEEAVGHYVVTVAQRLLGEGLPVVAVHAFGNYDEPSQNEAEDIEGGITFGAAFQQSILPGGDVGLHWAGPSGWCLYLLPEGSSDLYEGARWMGAGLLPAPERVAAFVSSTQLDPLCAGSDERPFYRSPRAGLAELLDRLKGFEEGPHRYAYRFRSALDNTSRRRIVDALRSDDEVVADLPLRRSELDAVLHALVYIEATGLSYGGPDDPLVLLAADLKHRFGQGTGSAQEHREAVVQAHGLHQRMEEHRLRRKRDDH